MATIVQADDFTGEITIAQLSYDPVVQALQEDFIDPLEPEFLTMLLGKSLYDELIAGLQIDEINEDEPVDPPPVVDPKWTKLIEQIGKSIAQYIYWFYIQDGNTTTSGSGEKKANSDNSVNASPGVKMCNAWNKMVKTCYKVAKFINDNKADYGPFYITNLYAYGYENSYCNKPQIFTKVNPYGI